MSIPTPERPKAVEQPSNEPDQTAMLFRSGAEREWEARRNTFVEAHPLLIGYAFLAVPSIAIFTTELTTFAVAFLFLFLVSDFLTNDLRRYVPYVPKVVMFSLLYVGVITLSAVLAFKLVPDAVRLIPSIAASVREEAIHLFEMANERWNLTKFVTREDVIGQITEGVSFARALVPSATNAVSNVSMWVIYVIFALVLNLLIYHDGKEIEEVFSRRPTSLLGFLYRFTIVRVRVFYYYFKRVMGGQIVISAINTGISALVIFGLGLPQPFFLVLMVFLCGLMPIVGNLVSNTVLMLTALASIGLWGAAVCISLLIGIHKLEYFLNSKIIGDIVHLPMAVTLAALVVCEVVLGIVGLILAIPLLLFLRHELEHIPGLPPTHPADPSRAIPLIEESSAGAPARRRTLAETEIAPASRAPGTARG